MNLEKLSKPLTPEEIEWRVQSINSKKKTTTVVPYIANRTVIKRFNAAFGPFGWQSKVRQIQAIKTESYASEKWVNRKKEPTNVMDMDGGFIASIIVLNTDTGEWVTKEDISDNTDIEALKGGVSGAYKRAAVHWGLGIELYEYPMVQIEGEHKFIPRWAYSRLDDIVKGKNEGTYNLDYTLLKEHADKQPVKKNQPQPEQTKTHKQPQAYEIKVLTQEAFKQWKGGSITKWNERDCLEINGRKWWLTPQQVEWVKNQPGYKE